MIKADFSNSTDSEWFAFLASNIGAENRTELHARLRHNGDPAAPPPENGTALDKMSTQLLSFYIQRANKQAVDGAPTAQDVLAGIAETLQPEKEAPVSEPAAAASPEQKLVLANDPGLIEAIRLVYQLTVKRSMAEEEVRIWLTNMTNGLPFHEFLQLMYNSDEATSARSTPQMFDHLNDAEFIQTVYRQIEKRGALPNEIEIFRKQLAAGTLTRQSMITNFFASALDREASGADSAVHDGLSCQIMGTGQLLKLSDWEEQAKDEAALADARAALTPQTPYTISPRDDVLRVSAITSLFRGGDFIEQFMDNMVGQTCFDKYTELLIIDADSPENEAETIERYTRDMPNIRYKRMNSCIGIYEAWNIGVEMSRGTYLTNANLDDLRREDSFEIQAGALDALPFVDVVYQDFYYSFDPKLNWEQVAAYGHKSDVPVITPYNMLRFNSPHNAPMWRRSLHDEVGLFDASFKSAGDYEFWMRCLTKGKSFFKINEPHVVYYQNPKGLSTRADTRGVIEAREVLRRYADGLVSPHFTAPLPDLAQSILGLTSEDSVQTPNRNHLAQAALRALSRNSKPLLQAV